MKTIMFRPLLIETMDPTLSRGMKHLNGSPIQAAS